MCCCNLRLMIIFNSPNKDYLKKYCIASIQDLTCAIADLGLCVKHDPDTDAVDFPPEMGAVDDGGSVKVR